MSEEMIVKLRQETVERSTRQVDIFAYLTQQSVMGSDGLNIVIANATLFFEGVVHNDEECWHAYYVRIDRGEGEDDAGLTWVGRRFTINFVEPEYIRIPMVLFCPNIDWAVYKTDVDPSNVHKVKSLYLRARIKVPRHSG